MKMSEAYEMYNDFLNEMHPVNIVGLDFNASEILKELDPITYDCGFSDFCDCENIEIGDEDEENDEDE